MPRSLFEWLGYFFFIVLCFFCLVLLILLLLLHILITAFILSLSVGLLDKIYVSEQVAALGYCVRYAQKHLIDGKKNLIQIVDELEEVMQNKSLAELCESTSSVSCMAVPRRQEIFACFDRYRALRLV